MNGLKPYVYLTDVLDQIGRWNHFRSRMSRSGYSVVGQPAERI
nr:transposase domain-containing protein [uncultured Eisenbergiella sp.]